MYCMPAEPDYLPREVIITTDEILRLFRLFVELGFDKIRLTGGEPLVHPDVVEIVREMAHTPGVREVTMTTNGILLERYAQPLKEVGLDRCNISLDTLDPGRYCYLTRLGDISHVLRGIEAAESVGLLPIKLNAVVARSITKNEDVVDLARLSLEHPWHIRYIEMMPFGDEADFAQREIVSEDELRGIIEAELGQMAPENGGRLVGEAHVYRLSGAPGTVGFISSVTKPFCASCSRARLMANGQMRMCLLRDGEMDLITPLREGASDDALKHLIRKGIWRKPWGHGLAYGLVPSHFLMGHIGG